MEQKMKIAVLGGGTMGPGIAVSYALGGHPTTVYSRSEKTVTRAESVGRSSLSLFVEEGMITGQQMEEAMALLRFSTNLDESVSGCGYIAETIVEKPDAKQELYEKLDAILPADVIIAKGMGNTESMYGCGYNVYYAFLVKCARLSSYFHQPLMTPMLVHDA